MKIVLNYAQYKYLKDNNLLEAYKRNTAEYCNKVEKDGNHDYSDINFIGCAFTWIVTPEGSDFWKEHSAKSGNLRSVDLYTLEL